MSYQSYNVDENTSYHWFGLPECNLTSPIPFFEKALQDHNYNFAMSTIRAYPAYERQSTRYRLELAQRFRWKAKQQWNDEYIRLTGFKLHPNLYLLLSEQKKKAQQKLIKDIPFNTDTLMSLPIQAWKTYKLLFSRFVFEYQAKELAGRIYPAMMYKKDDGEFDYVGITDLSPSEMKVAVEKKHRVICDFVGDEEYWHCFFRTESGIKGNEAPHIGEPHLHYISSAWGMSRKDVIANLSSYRYSLKAETIKFIPRYKD